MSSAILYVAIVAIWACVLIPRWLRRDAARGADTAVPGDAVPGDVADDFSGVGGDVADEEEYPEDSAWADTPVRTKAPVWAEAAALAEAAAWTEMAAGTDTGADRDRDTGRGQPDYRDVPEPRGAPASAPDEARRRMLAARRRLLIMLAVVEAAAIALAVSRFAAMWVLIPPSVMVAGYLLLLREAARGDAERVRRDAQAAQARARAQERARERAARRAQPARVPAAPVAAAAPVRAARYEDAVGGRDFAPGLAGKYTTSNAAVIDMYERPDEDSRDRYAMEKLRAVGD